MRAHTLAALLIGALLIAAGTAYYLSSTATGTLVIQVRDVPAAWSHVTVLFSRVEVHAAGGANDSGWLPLALSVNSIDFVGLTNLTALLAQGHIAPGTYTQIRIIVTSVDGILSGGQSVTMEVPDGVLKTATPFTLRGGGTTVVTIDLDLARSIHQANGLWVFSPVLGPLDVQ